MDKVAFITEKTSCYHCGEDCSDEVLTFDEKLFCCSGCLSVYQILNQHQLSAYYCMNEAPGQKLNTGGNTDKFNFLELDSVVQHIVKFSNKDQTQVEFYLPQIHCSSCLWLLEHLSEMNEAILSSQVNFTSKMITITFNHHQLNVRSLAELLASIGYEPLIDIHQPEQHRLKEKYDSKTSYLKIGIAGFCFANIMLISFPEYLGLDPKTNPYFLEFFKWTNLVLSLPVIFYSAREFFENSYYSFKQRYLNIDVPIALAITVTFLRSLYEVISGTGVGFFDSMTGIVFFMLLGRTLQNRTYTTLSFSKDYQSYFPLAVTQIIEGRSEVCKVQEIQEHDVLFIHQQEVIPTDCLLSKGTAHIDYSYITGEAVPEKVDKGSIIYAGGRNAGEALEVVVLKPFSDNSFTKMWNNNAFEKRTFEKEAMTTIISKYFSLAVILISLSAFLYWQFVNPANAWNAATAVLIIACPCALLLAASFTNGYLLELLAKYGVFYKNAQVIEKMSKCQYVAFDKTGTITEVNNSGITVIQNQLSNDELQWVLSAMSQSSHPLSMSIVAYYGFEKQIEYDVQVEEIRGNGLRMLRGADEWRIGSRNFALNEQNRTSVTEVVVAVNGALKAVFEMNIRLKEGIKKMMDSLADSLELSLISGDNESARMEMRQLFPKGSVLKFNCSPEDKLHHIAALQNNSRNIVMMVGDGLNDAGALKQSDIGITVVKNSFSFSPACDIIIEERQLPALHRLIQMNKASQRLIWFGFAYSLVFNVIGIYFSINAQLSPLLAAILMPSSSLGIILISFIGIQFIKNKYLTNAEKPLMEKDDKNHVLV